MKRKIIHINKEKCNGCGLCVTACHEGAIEMQDGKAKLVRDDYCDGLGDCLPVCPAHAITFEEREALPYDEQAVKAHVVNKQMKPLACGCPGVHARSLAREEDSALPQANPAASINVSELQQWPVQIQLAPTHAPYFQNARLLIAADCAAYAFSDFHAQYMRNRITLIGCPKLDHTDYAEKLTDILSNNEIQSITVVRMEVPCCAGIEQAVKAALINSGKMIPWHVVTLSTSGGVLDQ